MKGKTIKALSLALAFVMMLTVLGMSAFAEEETHDVAIMQAFIVNDPLNGDNGMETSPAAPLKYGPVNIAMDVDGNAIEAVDEQDLFYADGHYYLIGQSYAEGAFNYAPGVPYDETISTNIPTFYRWSGVVTYRSDDLENWVLVNRWYPQRKDTNSHIIVKKPRVVYSEATEKYVMWFLNNNRDNDEQAMMYVTADSMEGPWSEPQAPSILEGMTYSDITHDYQIKIDPSTGTGWFTQAGTYTHLYKLTPEMTGIAEDYSFEMTGAGDFGENMIAGGMGFFYHNGWWYITGTPRCGNCIGTKLSYVMAKSPEGPWLSPDTMSDEQPLMPSLLSMDIGLAQTHGAAVFPDGNGDTSVLIYATHYRSSATGAPMAELVFNNSGENSLALSGQWWFTLEFEEDGRIKPLEIKPTYEISLANPVDSEHVQAWQADLSITNHRSVKQTWKVEEGEVIASIVPSVFQQTPDESPSSNKWVAQDALVNAPLNAALILPNGTEYHWTVDARTIAWAPRQIALNLPEVYTDGGELTLILSTKATNGGYGVALGEGSETDIYAHTEGEASTEYPGSRIYMCLSNKAELAPIITVQPKSITVTEGTRVGFLCLADGTGVGYQWYHNGAIVMPHGVTEGTRNESASAALRLTGVTMEDAGEYKCIAMNTAGKVESVTVTLTVLPKE